RPPTGRERVISTTSRLEAHECHVILGSILLADPARHEQLSVALHRNCVGLIESWSEVRDQLPVTAERRIQASIGAEANHGPLVTTAAGCAADDHELAVGLEGHGVPSVRTLGDVQACDAVSGERRIEPAVGG